MSPGVLDRFIARVESNRHAEAIEEFYAPDASMREDDLPPRRGRDTLAAHERKVLARTPIEELAWQRWAGERIAEEKFFYDPAQLAAR